MQDSNEKGMAENGQKAGSVGGTTIFLLLFVGFIFGLITGFATKDKLVRSYMQAFNKVVPADIDSDSAAMRGMEGEGIIVEEVITVDAADADKKPEEKKTEEEKKAEEEKKKDEEKKAEEKKPEEKKPE